MTRILPHIRLVLTIALLVAVAPLCATVLTCESCPETARFADDRGVLGEVVKRPVLPSCSAPSFALAVPLPPLHRDAPSDIFSRFLAPAPVVPLRS
jgi:hypothetical protein